jgi:hypothetical protein
VSVFFWGAILFYSQSVIDEPWGDLATFGYKLNMKVRKVKKNNASKFLAIL